MAHPKKVSGEPFNCTTAIPLQAKLAIFMSMEGTMISKRTILILMCVLGAIFSGLANALPFSQMPKWRPDKIYRSGDVVANQYDIYVALLPSKGQDPKTSRLWRKARYSRTVNYQINKLYIPAAVVKQGEKFYLALHLNVPLAPSSIFETRHWLEFTHPSLSYSLPVPEATPDNSTLLGIDSNQNKIRDDYEIAVAYSDLPPEVMDAALTAGKTYGQLMASGSTTTVDASTARTLLEKSVRAEQCKRQMAAAHGGSTWKESTFFNTVERVQAKYSLQNMLA